MLEWRFPSERYRHAAVKQSTSILIVDDDQASAILTAEILRSSGYTVVTAADGFKAIASCKVRMPDLILLDTHMPMLSGVDVYNRLRNEEKTQDIPVIFLSQPQDENDEKIQKTLQGEDFINKPVQPSELLARVKTALRVKSLKDEIKKKEGQIKELSLVDPLTSLRNTRFLNEFLKAEVSQCDRYGVALSIVVLELDRNKELLKIYGTKAADSLVAQMAAVMSRQSRQSDILARVGSFEFAVVLPHTTREGAIEVAERTRNTVADSTFTVGEHTVKLTISLGICQHVPGMDTEGKILMSHAREALSQAHEQGGNITLMAH
jgi:diguanylate cyclase (GGDEF)-like protein